MGGFDSFDDGVQAEASHVIGHPTAGDGGWVDTQQLRQRRAELRARKPVGLEQEHHDDGEKGVYTRIVEAKGGGALLADHERSGAAATIVVAQVRSPFGVVDLAEDGTVTGFKEAPKLPHWVNSGVYALEEEAIARLPERGDHEQSTFPSSPPRACCGAFATRASG